MDFLARKVRDFANVFLTQYANKQQQPERNRPVNRYEVYFEYIYRVLIWDDVMTTCFVFLTLNFLFWLAVVWELKLFAIVFITTLAFFTWDCYYQTKSLDGWRGQYTDIIDEFFTIASDVVASLISYRKDNPSSFCFGMSVMFLFLSILGRTISGYLLFYLTLLAIFFMPLAYKSLPDHYRINIKQTLRYLGSNRDVLAEDELIPFISQKDFNRKDPELESLLTDRTVDSVSNSFTSGAPSLMPSYLDVDNETRDDLLEDDLLPIQSSKSATPDRLSDTDSEGRGIHFDTSHFKGDSSSEEENMYVRGLKYAKDVIDYAKEGENVDGGFIGGILSNMATMGSSLIGNASKSGKVIRKDSSSDSEFEIVNTDDAVDESAT